MKRLKFLALCIPLSALFVNAPAQKTRKSAALVCKPEVFARLKPLPKLDYECAGTETNDSDETILKTPERRRAINDYMRRLATSLHSPAWWETSVDDLNLCYFRGSAGEFSADEKERFRLGDYQINLFGNDRIRLILTSDPCYQTGYNGSNAFLLYRQNDRVTVTQVLDGYYSRADNSVGLDFARLNSEQLVEVYTSTGGLVPYITNYYFVIDEKTGKAVPKRLFKEGKTFTNQMTSAMILDDGTIHRRFPEMEVVKGNRLAARFNVYEDSDAPGSVTFAGRSVQRRVYRWNGQYYSRIKQ